MISRRMAPFLLLLPLALAGCATGQPSAAPTEASPVADAAATTWLCWDEPIDPDRAVEEYGIASLSDTGLEALDGIEVPAIDRDGGWIVQRDDDELVVLSRALEEPLWWADEVRTHETLQVFKTGAGDWHLGGLGDCALRAELPGGAVAASVFLDPERLPEPDDTTVHLLVMEHGCSGRDDASGRLSTLQLTETVERVEVVIAVTERPGIATCPTHPATPYSIDLENPLADRPIVDVAVLPALVAEPYEVGRGMDWPVGEEASSEMPAA